MSIETWFKKLNEKQKNVVIATSGLFVLAIIGHLTSRPYSSMGWINNQNDFVFIISLIVSAGAFAVYVFRGE
jgi:hypothetical protein